MHDLRRETMTALTTALLIGLGQTAPAGADVPVVGFWGFDDCAQLEDIELQGHQIAAYHGEDGIEIISQLVTKTESGGWYLVRTDPLDPYPSLMRRQDDRLVNAWPLAEPVAQDEIAALHTALASGEVEPDTAPDAFDIDLGRSCDALPTSRARGNRDFFEALAGIDASLWSCGTYLDTCVDMIFALADADDDARLSRDETERAARIALRMGSAVEMGWGQSASASLRQITRIAPQAADRILALYDDSGSGYLESDEARRAWADASLSPMPQSAPELVEWIRAVAQAVHLFAEK